jgi:hypothetical protein
MNNRPNTAAEVAASLRAVAEKFAALGDAPLPNIFVSIDLLPHGGEDAEVAAVDLIGQALYGRTGETREMSSPGTYHHSVRGTVAGISVDAYTSVTSPQEREMRAEIARLRAQLGTSAAEVVG